MRTTIDLPEELHQAASALSHHSGRNLSQTVAELMRRGLAAPPQAAPPAGINPATGLPLFQSTRTITPEDVRRLDDE